MNTIHRGGYSKFFASGFLTSGDSTQLSLLDVFDSNIHKNLRNIQKGSTSSSKGQRRHSRVLKLFDKLTVKRQASSSAPEDGPRQIFIDLNTDACPMKTKIGSRRNSKVFSLLSFRSSSQLPVAPKDKPEEELSEMGEDEADPGKIDWHQFQIELLEEGDE